MRIDYLSDRMNKKASTFQKICLIWLKQALTTISTMRGILTVSTLQNISSSKPTESVLLNH